MLQSGEHGAQIHRELQTGGPKQNARLYFQNSFHRKECKTERDKRAWTRHLYVKLQIKCTRFKGIHTFFFLCNETILKNVEKYYHIVKTMELEESRIPSWIHIVRIVRSIAYCKLCLFEAFDVTWRPKLMAQLASCVCIWFSFNSCCNSMSPNFSGWPDPSLESKFPSLNRRYYSSSWLVNCEPAFPSKEIEIFQRFQKSRSKILVLFDAITFQSKSNLVKYLVV